MSDQIAFTFKHSISCFVAHPALCPQERFLLFFAYDQTAPVERGGVFGVPTVDVGLPRGREEVS